MSLFAAESVMTFVRTRVRFNENQQPLLGQNVRAKIQYVGKSICSWICDENCKAENEFLISLFKKNLGTFLSKLDLQRLGCTHLSLTGDQLLVYISIITAIAALELLTVSFNAMEALPISNLTELNMFNGSGDLSRGSLEFGCSDYMLLLWCYPQYSWEASAQNLEFLDSRNTPFCLSLDDPVTNGFWQGPAAAV